MVSVHRGWCTQRANPRAPAAQSPCVPVPRGPSTRWATTVPLRCFVEPPVCAGDQAPREPTLGPRGWCATMKQPCAVPMTP